MSEQNAEALSLNVGSIRNFEFQGQRITGFYKSPVIGRVRVRGLGLVGDHQADLTVHGGPLKAVYFYPSEHYLHWESVIGSGPHILGLFGENVNSKGLLASDVCVGDTFRVGTALLQVIQPRSPCYKLGLRFQVPDMVERFVKSGRPGWYETVLAEGGMTSGDTIGILSRASDKVTIADVWRFSLETRAGAGMRRRVQRLDLLPAFRVRRRVLKCGSKERASSGSMSPSLLRLRTGRIIVRHDSLQMAGEP